MKHWFVKEILSNTFSVGGKPVPFVQLQNNRGVIELDDADAEQARLVEVLSEAASKHRAGIVRVTEAQAAEVKKNSPPSSPSGPKLKPSDVRVWKPLPERRAKVTAPVAAQPVDLGLMFSRMRAAMSGQEPPPTSATGTTPAAPTPEQTVPAEKPAEAVKPAFKPETRKLKDLANAEK